MSLPDNWWQHACSAFLGGRRQSQSFSAFIAITVLPTRFPRRNETEKSISPDTMRNFRSKQVVIEVHSTSSDVILCRVHCPENFSPRSEKRRTDMTPAPPHPGRKWSSLGIWLTCDTCFNEDGNVNKGKETGGNGDIELTAGGLPHFSVINFHNYQFLVPPSPKSLHGNREVSLNALLPAERKARRRTRNLTRFIRVRPAIGAFQPFDWWEVD